MKNATKKGSNLEKCENRTTECMRKRNDGVLSNSRLQRWSENRGDESNKEMKQSRKCKNNEKRNIN